MTNIIKEIWPLYVTPNDTVYISHVNNISLRATLGGQLYAEYAMRPEVIRELKAYATTESVSRPTGPAGILAIAMALNQGRPFFLSEAESAMTVRFLTYSDRPELLEKLVKTLDTYQKRGHILGLAHLNATDERYGSDFLKEAIGRNNSAHVLRDAPVTINAAIDSCIAVCRKKFIDTRTMCLENSLNYTSVNTYGDFDQDLFRWICNDPWKRLFKFNRPELVKTVEAIKKKFPFALPSEMDLDTRDAEGIMDGIEGILRKYSDDELSMDPYRLHALMLAYDRLMDLSAPTAREIESHVQRRILGFSIFRKDAVAFAKRVLSRMPDKTIPAITLYIPETECAGTRGNRENVVKAILCDGRTVMGICIKKRIAFER